MNDPLKPSEWPDGGPAPTNADGSKPPYRVVVDQRRPGGTRYVFTFQTAKTLAEFRSWLGCYYHPESARLELDSPTTEVWLDTLQPDGTYQNERLKSGRTPTFGEVVHPDRQYGCSVDSGEPPVNPQPMTPDPVISNYFDEEIERLIVGQKITGQGVAVTLEQLVNATTDLNAAHAQRVADYMHAKWLEKMVAGVQSEQATRSPYPNPQPHTMYRLLTCNNITVRSVLNAWKMGLFPSLESALTALSAELLAELTAARAEIARLAERKT